ncbi:MULTISPECIES: transcription repressor NadR [unclassified Jeotgalibaca]|uniref:transcription repressor NadR n=1 Tax=unclassified Jeotgalibaca TaxID=2621505 RepID=UPI003FD168B3
MSTVARRQEILECLKRVEVAVSARKLAEQFNVSRQVIVGDIALLRAEGYDILSTPRGYLLPRNEEETYLYQGKIVCLHTADQTKEELQIIVDNGGQVLDVIVEHPLYGTISGKLRIANRFDIKEYLKEVKKNESKMLASLTGGIHTHTIQCKDKKTFNRIKSELETAGILYG